MTLTPEWKARIENWMNAMEGLFYTKTETFNLSGFITKEALEYDDALKREFIEIPYGTSWGDSGEYGWFMAEISVPEDAEIGNLVAKIDVGAECAVYIDGRSAGAIDKFHNEIYLSDFVSPGKKHKIIIEAFAGIGTRFCKGGPVPEGQEIVQIFSRKQGKINEISTGYWNELIYQLWIDVKTLYDIRNSIDQNLLRVDEIDDGLKDFTRTLDIEHGEKIITETAIEARERLKPLLECKNGSTVPVMYMFGHSHIDIAWLWTLDETQRKCNRTFATQLALTKIYPEYKFLQSQAYLFDVVKNKNPDLYKRIREAVKSGNFVPEGGMWVESDTNVPSGESLIRQFLYGKKFYKEEFGVESRLLWLPDVFGYSGNLPQIMRGCGIKYFSTAKLAWIYDGGEDFPYNNFSWEGIDGSEILSQVYYDYNARTNPALVNEYWNNRRQRNKNDSRIYPFGYGDGGGGPTRDHLEYIGRCKNLEGVPAYKMSHPCDIFEHQESKGSAPEKYVGELYFSAHRGTYTTHAKAKKYNRQCEYILRELEFVATLASEKTKYQYPYDEIESLWKTVLKNQFHDIIPGSSITEVYETAYREYEQVIKRSNELIDECVSFLTGDFKDDNKTIFNPLSWDVERSIAKKGNPGDTYSIEIPSMGFKIIPSEDIPAYDIEGCGKEEVKDLTGGNISLENNFIKVVIESNGEISSVKHKKTQREFSGGKCNRLMMYKDVPNMFDAWDINSMYEETPVKLSDSAKTTYIKSGNKEKVRVEKKIHNSLFAQEIFLKENSSTVYFKTRVEWEERHKLLKVEFPLGVHAGESVHEIQYGYIKRPNNFSTQLDKDRFEVCNQKWTALYEESHGAAVLNDCKYGVSVKGKSINLTLLKSSIAPDPVADKGVHEFTYGLNVWEGSFLESPVVKEGFELNLPVKTFRGKISEGSVVGTDNPSVIADTVKKSDDKSGDIIIRLYESKRTSCNCRLMTSFDFSEAYICDMLENITDKLDTGNGIVLEFSPFEVKTLRLRKQG